jgi:hypothetical protein
MKCPVCSTSMAHRAGKHGSFFVCKEHGTASIQGGNLVCTGEIFQWAKRISTSNRLSVDRCVAFQNASPRFDLEFEVRKQALIFGVDITELDRFIECGQEAADDDEDHWMNLRPDP